MSQHKTKYNIIGDNHCRECWKQLVKDDCINIFVGDYFSPYDKQYVENFAVCKANFLEIIEYKKQHPETILLLGNHDLDHWYVHEKYSRFDIVHYQEIYNLFEENKDLFQIAYAIDNKVLVTHAGVSAIWYERYHRFGEDRWKTWYLDLYNYKYDGATTIEEAYKLYVKHSKRQSFLSETKKLDPISTYLYFWEDGIYKYVDGKFVKNEYDVTEVADFINNLFVKGLEENNKIDYYYFFNFQNNCGPTDYYGDDERQSPVWIRPSALKYTNIFNGQNIWQVVGHTMFSNITINNSDKLIFCDCLQYSTESLIYDSETNEIKINKI